MKQNFKKRGSNWWKWKMEQEKENELVHQVEDYYDRTIDFEDYYQDEDIEK